MKLLVCTGLLALSASVAWAQSTITVQEPWVRATVGQQTATGAFMRLTAPADSRVLQVQSPLAGVVEIHEMKMEGDVMRMRAVSALPLPAGQAVELKPGGYHVMLMDLKAPVKAGDVVPLTLTVEDKDGRRSVLEDKAAARALNAVAPAADGHGHGGHKH
mgnify:CR=1 FL=1